MKRIATTTLAFVARGPRPPPMNNLLFFPTQCSSPCSFPQSVRLSLVSPLASTLAPVPSIMQLHTLPEHPRPVVICGPSGVGKGTIIDRLMNHFPSGKFGFSVSHTTRAPREGEVHGKHYNFTTVDQIKKDIEDGKFIEYAEVHGNYYGTSLCAVESVQNEGKICVLDIDVQGVRNVKQCPNLDPIYVFVAPPSMENLENRLRGRGTEEEESIQRRLANAKAEIDYGYEEGNFDKILVNNELDVAVEELAESFKDWYPNLLEED